MRSLISSLWCVLPAVAVAQVVPPYFSPNAVPDKRTCSSNTYVVEAPAWAPPLADTFAARLTSALPPRAEWFGCSGLFCSYRTVVTPVLRDLTAYGTAVPVSRRDGHKRAFLVRFEWWSPFGPTWLTSTPMDAQQCNVVAALRKAVGTVSGVTLSCAPNAKGTCTKQPPVVVSRSCDVVGQDVEAVLPASTLEWAAQRMRVPTGGTQSATVALVDTGVPPGSQAAVGVLAEAPLPSFELGPRTFHPHGYQMAALIRSVAPSAQLRSYRALDGNGMGSLSTVARQVDDALFTSLLEGTTRLPLVVNLSVGAPGRFLRPTKLTGVAPSDNPTVACSTWEDGAGESLRYVLGVAGDLDAAGPAVLVAASSGNAVLEDLYATPAPASDAKALTPCDSGLHDAARQPSSFIPAAFGEQSLCRAGLRWAPVVSVGATTWRDRRSSLNQRDAPALVMAPGERVYANAAAAPVRTPSAVTCGSSVAVDPANGFQLPASVTGTSASAAYTSGAAARLLGQLPWTAPGWNARGLAQLLYVTGQPLCETVGRDQRRLDFERVRLAVTKPSCEALRTCVRSGPVSATVAAEVATRCAPELNACLGATSCTLPAAEPAWPASYTSYVLAAPSVCRSAWNAPLAPFPATPPPNALGRFPDLQLAGLGPQPSTSGCPNCAVLVSAGEVTLVFELSDAMVDGTELREAYVTILDEEKNTVAFLPVSDGFVWEPGQVGRIKLAAVDDVMPGLTDGLRDGRLRAALNLGLVAASGRDARLVSPLNVIAE